MKLRNRVAIITGGGTGIGAAAAKRFALEGARVCVAGRRVEPLNAVVDAIRDAGGEAMAVSGSVSDSADGQRIVEATLNAYHRVDILVNNAGTATLMDFTATTEELWDRIIDTNLKGVFLMSRAVIPVMLDQGGGAIVNISSILGQVGMKGAAVYCASKGGMDQFTRAMAIEFADKNIRINAVAPGWVDTSMTESVQAHPPLFESLRSRHPVGRFGTPEEVANAILFAASDDTPWMTGAILTIDGGWTAQ
jgi:NAD(P)-dependent dehydrogenase (short-subunit alcohol dehydrogenase family)